MTREVKTSKWISWAYLNSKQAKRPVRSQDLSDPRLASDQPTRLRLVRTSLRRYPFG